MSYTLLSLINQLKSPEIFEGNKTENSISFGYSRESLYQFKDDILTDIIAVCSNYTEISTKPAQKKQETLYQVVCTQETS